MRIDASPRPFSGAMVAGVRLGLLLFGLETSLSHVLLLSGVGWNGPLSLRVWLEYLLLYAGAGLGLALPLAFVSLFRHRSDRSDASVRTALLWLYLALYAGLIVAPLFRPRLGAMVFVIVPGPILAVGLAACRRLTTAPESLIARIFAWGGWTSLLFLSLGTIVNQGLLPGSTLLPRNLAANAGLGAACALAVAISPVTGARWRRRDGARRSLSRGAARAGFGVALAAYAMLLGAALVVGDTSADSAVVADSGRPSASAHPDLLLVIVDTLRADRLGAHGYGGARTPHLDALAARSTRYADHTSAAPWTYPAIASILTGHSPSVHGGVPVREVLGGEVDEGRYGTQPMRSDLPTLATVLEANGYETALIGTNPYLTRQLGLGRGFNHFQVLLRTTLPYVSLGTGFARVGWTPFEPADPSLPAAQMTDLFLSWLLKPRNHPVLLVAHYMDPHWPYAPPARVTAGMGDPPAEQGRPVSRMSDFYDAEVRYLDEQVGRLIDGLEQAGRLGDMVVAVTSDHGEAFMEHGSWVQWREKPGGIDPLATLGIFHGQTLYQELLHVPFLLYRPGRPGRIETRPSRAVDVMPTLLDAVGVAAPPGLEGEVIGRSSSPPPALSEAILSGHEKKAWRDGRYKLIFKPTHPSGDQLELYDLEADPGERYDLARSRPELTRRLAQALEVRLSSPGGGVSAADRGAPLDAATIDALRALGYVR